MNTQLVPNPDTGHLTVYDKKPVTIQLTRVAGFLDKLILWSWIIFFSAAAYQCLFWWSIPNLVAMLYVAFAWLLLCLLYFQQFTLQRYPLSSFLIIGFTATQFYFPLIFTSIELKSLVFNLDLPYEVFFHSTLSLFALIAGHYIYQSLPINTLRSKGAVLRRLGFFTPPSELQLWLMGAIGLMANIYVFFFSSATATEVTGNAGDKAIQAFLPFGYSPYFIPFYMLYGGKKPDFKKTVPLLIIFTLVLFLLSIARNSRGAFMLGFTAVGFSYLLGMMLGIFKTPVISTKIMVVGGFFFWLITGPLADLGTAMVIVRSQRNDISRAELIDLTLEAYHDKDAIAYRRLEDATSESIWDERYLDNIFTARFANIKFNDASLILAEQVGDHNPAVLKYSMDYMWGILPAPVLKVVNPKVDKEFVYSLSFGDYLYSVAGAGPEAYGGFRTGHFAGTGMAAFGWWYLAILGIGIIPVFLLFDRLCLIRKVERFKGYPERQLIFSVCGLLAISSIFQFLPTESVMGIVTYLIRGYLQMTGLYLAIFHVTKTADYLF